MPSWKKVIVSGSDASLNSLNVINGITGSLFGTSSFSTSASFAATASNILGGKLNYIPYFKTSTTLASSSLYQSGSFSVIINQDNATSANPEALYVWQPSTSINVISGKGNLNNYLQLNIQNTNQGVSASSDVVATANNGDESSNYIDMGINSQNYASGFIGDANDAYLYSTGRHLHIGNVSNFPVQIFAGGSNSDLNKKLEINPNNQHELTGSLAVSGSINVFNGITGSLFGTSSFAVSASYSLNSTSASFAISASEANFLDGYNATAFVLNSQTSSMSVLSSSFAISSSLAATATAATTITTVNNTGDAVRYLVWAATGAGNRTPNISTTKFVVNSATGSMGINKSTITSGYSLDVSGSVLISGSLLVTGSITGSLFGTASFATTSSYILNAVSASYALNTTSASYSVNSTSASFAISASHADLLDGYTATAFVLNSQTSSMSASYAVNSTSASFAISASHADLLDGYTATAFVLNSQTSSMSVLTASYAVNSTSASYASNADLLDGINSTRFATTGSNIFVGNQTITGSFTVTGSTTQIGNNTLTGNTSLTGSVNISGSTNIFGTTTFRDSSTTITGSLLITGSTTQIGNNNLFGSTTLSGSLIISGSAGTGTPNIQIYGDTGFTGYAQFNPVTSNINQAISASYIYVSGSTQDLYFTQNAQGFSNTTRLRWLESNLYTGLLSGGIISASLGSTSFTITSGSALIVSLGASTSSIDPYPTARRVSWNTVTTPLINSGSAKITYVGIDGNGTVVQQTVPWGSTDINQWDTQVELGVVLHLSSSVVTGVYNAPQLSYGQSQQTDDFIRAFGPVKISGHVLQVSGSSPTLSIKKTGGLSYNKGSNYPINPNHPSTVNDPAITTSKIYRYYISGSTPVIDTGINNAGYTTIDNLQYVDTTTGALASVGNSNWSIQRVFWIPNSPTNAFLVYYGNSSYPTLLDAVNAKDSEAFTEAPNTAANAIFLGYIIVEGGTGRDLLNPTEATIIQGGLFRAVGGVGSSGTSPIAITLEGLSDVSVATRTTGDLLYYNGSNWINSKVLTGNYGITGSLNVSSGITANLTGTASFATTASYASNADLLDGIDSTRFATTSSFNILSSSFNSYTSSLNGFSASIFSYTASQNALNGTFATTSSLNTLSSSFNSYTSSLNAFSASIFSYTASQNARNGTYATTGSNIFIGNQTITGSLTISSSAVVELNVIGNQIITGSLTVSQPITGSLFGTASFATTSSYILNAVSASYASNADLLDGIDSTRFATTGSNTFNGNQIITGSLAVGTSSLGPSENNLTLGARDSANEGGQVGFNAPGGTFTSASFIDNWSNFHRILVGTNASSTGLVAQWNLHSKQMELPAYTNASSFVGTATANLAVDSSGKVITVSTSGGSVFPYTGNAVITGSLTTTGVIYAQPNGAMYFQGGDDAALYDVNIVNTMGIYGVQDVTVGAVKLGSNGPVLYGSGSKLGLGTTTPTSASLTVNGNIWATSLTGSLLGTSSFAVSSSYALTSSYASTAQTLLGTVTSASYAGTSSFASTFTITNTLTFDQTLTDYASVTSTIVGTNNLFTQATGSYTSAFFKYTVRNGANLRAGEVFAVYSGSSVEFSDFSTRDLGSTSDVVMSAAIVGTSIQFNAVTATSGWNVKAIGTYM